MSDQSEVNFKQFDLLMSDVLEGQGSSEQIKLLNALLRQRAELRARYIAYVDMHSALADPVGALRSTSVDEFPDVLSEVIEQALIQRRMHDAEIEASRQLALQQSEEARMRRLRLRRDSESNSVKRVIVIPSAVVWLGMAAAMLLLAVVLWPDTASVEDPIAAGMQDPEPPAIETGPVVVAELTAGFDAKWRDNAPDPDAGLFSKRYTLDRGWVQVRTIHGVDLVLEAPVTVEFNEANEMSLVSGQLVADVPRQAIGFTVQTPTGRVVDYGTTFGVAVEDAGETITHVFSGEVEVASTTHAGNQPLRLVKDQAASVGREGVVERAAVAPERFARDVPANAYQAAIMKSRPMCYWRGPIDPDTRQLKDYGWLQAHGMASETVRQHPDGFTPEDSTGSLDFSGEQGGVLVPFRDAFRFDGAFSVEAWCWIDPNATDFMRVISTRSESGGIGLGVLGQRGRIDQFQSEPNAPFFTFYGTRDVVSASPLPVGQWAYLVVTVDETRACAFWVNGRRIHAIDIPFAGERVPQDTHVPLMIGRNPFTGVGAQGWHGKLDEVAIYDRVLNDSEIQEHYLVYQRP